MRLCGSGGFRRKAFAQLPREAFAQLPCKQLHLTMGAGSVPQRDRRQPPLTDDG